MPMQQVRPKKALGQHFLTDLNIAHDIADTISAYRGTAVLEVGPGMGVLTQFLIEAGHNLKVVEIDNESIEYLNRYFPQLQGKIIADDFLRLNLDDIADGPMCIIGNSPYNISSQIFFHILDFKDKVVCCSGMFQKEVAERIAA